MSTNKNLREYIKIVEQADVRSDRPGRGYDPTFNPHAAADAARQAPVSRAPASTEPKKWKNVDGGQVNLAGFNKAKTAGTNPKPTAQATSTRDSQASKTRVSSQRPARTGVKPSTAASAVTGGQAAKVAAKPTSPTASTTARTDTPAASPKPNQYGVELSPEEVKQRQQFLVNLGHNIKVDGIWGAETEAAYKTAFPGQASGSTPATTPPPTSTSSAPTGNPDEWTKAKLNKPGQSADMAAAVGMPNPYVKVAEESDLSRIKDLINYKN